MRLGFRHLAGQVAFLVTAGGLFYLASKLLAFAQLFAKLGPHSGIRVTQLEIFDAHNATDARQRLIPRTIHHIFHNWKDPEDDTMPEDWLEMRQTCIDKNPGWDFKLWHVRNSLEFMEKEFPWFVDTYHGYKYPIQRVDVMRYFALRHFGGIYIDLDNGCEESLDALTYLPAFTTDGGLGALSNNIIGSQHGHPWIVMMTENLQAYHWNLLFFHYAIIMYNSGQWYLTAIWEKYHGVLAPDGSLAGFEGRWTPLPRIMMDGRPGADRWVFFNHGGHGETWVDGDKAFWAWAGDHWAVAMGAVALAVLGCFGFVWCYRRRREASHTKAGFPTAVADRL